MLNNRELMELHSKLDDATSMYLKAKDSPDECFRRTMPVRASNLYAILIVLENIKGIHFPDALTQAVRNQCQADAQEAFKDVPGIDQEALIEDCTKDLGQPASELPPDWKCYTLAEVNRIVSNVIARIKD